MASVKDVENEIRKTEHFDAVIRRRDGQDVRSQLALYLSSPAARNNWTVAQWKEQRFSGTYPEHEVDVLDSRGNIVAGNTLLSTVRGSYTGRPAVADSGRMKRPNASSVDVRTRGPVMSEQRGQFEPYLTAAVKAALQRAASGEDEGLLWRMNELCRRGVQRSWDRLGERAFLKEFLWVVGAIQKPYEEHLKYYPRQVKLFRGCVPRAIWRDQTLIRQEWQSRKVYLNSRMVEALVDVSCRVASEGWETFKSKTLKLPRNPESEDPADWRGTTYVALDALPMIGDANVWFLLRNLFGAPFLKPDIFIKDIANRFFGAQKDPVAALSAAVRASWPRVCRERRLLPVHLGEADIILWTYERRIGRFVA